MPRLRPALLAALAAPLALALAACGSDEEGAVTGEPIAPIAAPAGANWIETAAETPEGGFVTGNPDAPLKLVEYASHTCPACAAFSTTGAAALDEYVAKGVVSYEIRNQIHNPVDLTIAMLARCGAPTAFHPLANQVWANLPAVVNRAQQDQASLSTAMEAPDAQRFQRIAEAAGLLEFFAARGVSRDQALQCLADTGKARQIAANSDTQSEEFNVTGTPTFFLNGRLVEGTTWGPGRDDPGIEAALQNAGAR